MFFVTRKIGESVVITGLPGSTRELKVSVMAVNNGIVRLGFESDSEEAAAKAIQWNLFEMVNGPENLARFVPNLTVEDS